MGANQTSFKPGEVHNPSGRPKRDWTWSGVLQQAVEKADATGKTVKEEVADSLVSEAKRGNVFAAKELMNRMDGMPAQKLEHGGEVQVRPILGGTSKQLEEGEE